MKIKLFESFTNSLVDQKCDLLDELTLELKDLGLEVIISKKPLLFNGFYYGERGTSRSIILIIKDNKKILKCDRILHDDMIKEFILDLNVFGMRPRQSGGGDKFCYFIFDKWGKMTNSEVLKKNENFRNDERTWRLTDEMKSKIDSEIGNVLIELVDNGFEIEIDHFAKKISGDNSILVTINKVNDTQIFNTNDVKDNILVLIDYMNENYGVKGYDYGIEIPGTRSAILPGGKSKIDKEYPDNLQVIEIDVDITI